MTADRAPTEPDLNPLAMTQSVASIFAVFGLVAMPGMGWMLARSTAGLPPFSLPGRTGQSPAAVQAATLRLVATEFTFAPKELRAAAPGQVTLQLDNQGLLEHDVTIEGARGRAYAGPKRTGEGTFTLPRPGTYAFYCSILGHREAGMAGTLVVGDGTATATTAREPAGTGSTATAAHASHASHAAVVATQQKGNQVLAPQVVDGVKVFTLTSRLVKWEVLPGVLVDAMAYNDQVPGPLLRVTEGDRVRVVFRNELPEPSVIHFHGPRIPNAMDGVPDVTQPVVKPGESFNYEFTASPAGTYMYHSHHNSVIQEPAGQHGLIIIDPKPGSAEAQRDARYDHDVIQVLNEFSGYFTVNGKAFPATEPIAVKVGERVRIRLVNLGQALHPMHLHGYHFQIVGTDGRPVEGPPLEKDTVTLGPGERYDLEFEADTPGTWVFHCHILSHVANQGVEPGGMLTGLKVS